MSEFKAGDRVLAHRSKYNLPYLTINILVWVKGIVLDSHEENIKRGRYWVEIDGKEEYFNGELLKLDTQWYRDEQLKKILDEV